MQLEFSPVGEMNLLSQRKWFLVSVSWILKLPRDFKDSYLKGSSVKSQVLIQMFTLSPSLLIFVAKPLLRRAGNQKVRYKSSLVYIVYHNGVSGIGRSSDAPRFFFC